MVRIIGVDPGLNTTGWAVIEKGDPSVYIASGVIRTHANDDLPKRLLAIHNGLKEVVDQFKPEFGAIENTYINKNFASSLLLSHARAALILTMAMHEIEVGEYQAKTIKKTITGSGSADKEQVAHMLKLFCGAIDFKTQDESDALAIAFTHSFFVCAKD